MLAAAALYHGVAGQGFGADEAKPGKPENGDQARQQLQEPELDEAFGGRRHPEVAQARGACAMARTMATSTMSPQRAPHAQAKFATASADCAASAFMAVLQK